MKARMRVLMLSWEFPPRIIGGIARHVSELSRALAGLGAEVHVVTPLSAGAKVREEWTPRTSRHTGGRTASGKLVVHRMPADPIRPLDFLTSIHQLNFSLCEAAWPVLREAQFDLLHAHDWLVAFAAKTLKHSLHLPLVGTIHATEHGRNRGLHTDLQRYIHSVEWLLAYEAWRVIGCSSYMRDEIEQVLLVPADKTTVIPNGVDIRRVAVPRRAEAGLGQFRLQFAGPNERIVVFVGRMVPEKGGAVLLEAWPRVLGRAPDTRLVLVGGGDSTNLQVQATRLGMASRVTFTGFLADAELSQLYRVADLAVFPSLYEPFGIVALEAMAARLPVVVSDAGGLPEVVQDGVTGVLTRAGDPDSLASGMLKALTDRDLAARLRQAGHRSAREDFGWERIARQTLDLYQRVVREAKVAWPRADARRRTPRRPAR